jgi:flavin-dependent dehydrogenase
MGAGTAGSSAAVAAARRGFINLVLEEGNCFVGVSTAGGVNEFYANLEGMGNTFSHLVSELTKFDALEVSFFKG